MWKYYAILSALFVAITGILAKVGVTGVGGNLANATRTVIVLIMAWGIVLLSGELKEIRLLTKANLVFLTLSGIATGLSWLFYFKALETGHVSKVVAIDKLSVAIAMGFAFVFLKEPIEIKSVVGGLLIIAGTFIIIW